MGRNVPVPKDTGVVVRGDKADAAHVELKPVAVEESAFQAQMLGQGGGRRGLKGGPLTLDHAKAVYLETEWSGPDDRRAPSGKIKKTDV